MCTRVPVCDPCTLLGIIMCSIQNLFWPDVEGPGKTYSCSEHWLVWCLRAKVVVSVNEMFCAKQNWLYHHHFSRVFTCPGEDWMNTYDNCFSNFFLSQCFKSSQLLLLWSFIFRAIFPIFPLSLRMFLNLSSLENILSVSNFASFFLWSIYIVFFFCFTIYFHILRVFSITACMTWLNAYKCQHLHIHIHMRNICKSSFKHVQFKRMSGITTMYLMVTGASPAE